MFLDSKSELLKEDISLVILDNQRKVLPKK